MPKSERSTSANERIESLFNLPGNRENFLSLFKFLSHPSKSLSLCRVLPEERLKIFEFFKKDPDFKIIHYINMVKQGPGLMKLQQAIIDAADKFGPKKKIFFIYNLESCFYLSKISPKDFFRELNLIRDFFIKFDIAFVFFVPESSIKEIIQNAFDFYDWMKFTFSFLPENKSKSKSEIATVKTKYSKPSKNIEYLESSIKKITDEKEKSVRLLELGILYHQEGEYDTALERTYESLEIEEKYDDPDEITKREYEIGLIFREKEAQKGPVKHAQPAAIVNPNFKWEELLYAITKHRVIPVFGHGLYKVDTGTGNTGGQLLYDYLAEKLSEASGVTLDPGENHQFAKACLAFRKYIEMGQDGFTRLRDFLSDALEKTRSTPSGSLLKLAGIKGFNIFITTAYDDFLSQSIKNVRRAPVTVSSYTLSQQWEGEDFIDKEVLNSISNLQHTLVYHLFGNIKNNIKLAYTEDDILETLLSFHNIGPSMLLQKNLCAAWGNSPFLFMGCGYDDWLYRLFIRILSNRIYSQHYQNNPPIFVADDFSKNRKLQVFLEENGANIFDTRDPCEFVDLLFDELKKKDPGLIIHPQDFPPAVFISFNRSDREIATRLASNLEKDGIAVWMDNRQLTPGMNITDEIIKAIDKCRVFIPLISQNSRQIITEDGMIKYHVSEWQYFSKRRMSDKDTAVIPVIIDDTSWVFDEFKDLTHLRVPGGQKKGNYRKLLGKLKEYALSSGKDNSINR